MATERRRRLEAVGAALLAAALWGGWFPVTRLGIVEGAITPADMVVLRCSVAAIFFLPLALRAGPKAGKAGWLGTVLILLTLSGPFAFFMGLGASRAPSAHAAILTPGTFPALVFLLGLWIFKDPATPRRWLGLLSVAIGVGLIANVALSGAEASYGYLFFHACAWMWAAYTIVVRYSGLSAAHAMAITNVGAALIYGPIWLFVGDTGLFDLSVGALAFQVGYHGLLNGLVAMFLYNMAVERLGAAEAAIFAALVPCFAAIAAWPVLGEPIGLTEAAALIAVGVGVALISGSTRPRVD